MKNGNESLVPTRSVANGITVEKEARDLAARVRAFTERNPKPTDAEKEQCAIELGTPLLNKYVPESLRKIVALTEEKMKRS